MALAKQGQPVKRQLWDTVRAGGRGLGGGPVDAPWQGKSLLQPILLRTGVFYQNALNYVAMLKAKVLYLPLGADGRLPHTDLADLGLVRRVGPAGHAGPALTAG